ncbi:MAG TPA: Gfo/Idh/MocA family oxidoreductase [Solirubrobacteraceae bacterium]|nr:Gfo/Idh/MocA family oxidoreductase [Solirubrobacteraceae bacterium]
MATVNWGILSTANINDKWLAGAREAGGTAVVAVASRDGARAQRYASDRGIPRAHDGYEALLADPEVDAVYIPLPNSLHVAWTRRALDAGKHVLCEKPISRHPDEVAELFDRASERGLVLMEAFMYRHHPQTARVQELVAEGAVGTLRMIRAAFSFPIAREDDVRLSTALDGGALMDVGCYCVNAARMLAGEPEQVRAFETKGGDGVDVTFAGVMRFAGDVLAHFDSGLVLSDRSQLEIVGDRGALLLSDPWHCREPGIDWRRDGETRRIAIEPADAYRLEVENLSAAIAGTARPLLGRDDAVGQAAAIEALLAAAV